jgi:hypothetical protein
MSQTANPAEGHHDQGAVPRGRSAKGWQTPSGGGDRAGRPRAAVEAASAFGWAGIADRVVGMTTFGVSARAVDLYPHFGITAQAAAHAARALLKHDR